MSPMVEDDGARSVNRPPRKLMNRVRRPVAVALFLVLAVLIAGGHKNMWIWALFATVGLLVWASGGWSGSKEKSLDEVVRDGAQEYDDEHEPPEIWQGGAEETGWTESSGDEWKKGPRD